MAAVVVATVVIAAAAVGVGVWLRPAGVEFPSRWDHRVESLVRFVEANRGHLFAHPVAVSFLTPAEYRRAISRGDTARPTAEERRRATRDVAEFRALGLISGNPDVLRAGEDLSDSGTLAYYDQDLDVVNVRGSEMSVGMRVTLVHELTHALQDQTFDLAAMLNGPDEAATAARSLLEGDATAVEDAYVASLSDAEQASYEAERQRQSDDAQQDLADVPKVLTTLFGLPYALGPPFVELVDAGKDGPRLDRIDAVYRRLPRTTAELFDPADYFDRARIVEPHAPGIADSTQPRTQTLGAGVLFVMLAERIPAATAMVAVDGWRGDSMRTAVVRRGGHDQVCAAAKVRLASRSDARQLASALDDWKAGMASQDLIAVSKPSSTHEVVFRTCDPGAKINVGVTGRSQDALGLPVLRAQVAAAQVNAGMPRDRALCVGTKVAAQLRPEDLKATDATPELRNRIRELVESAVSDC